MKPELGNEVTVLDRRTRTRSATERPAVGIRVLLVHSARLGRAALRALLEGEDDIAVVGETASAEEAVRLAREGRPDLVLMARSVHGRDGLSAIRKIRADADLSHVNVLLLAASASDEEIFPALRGGASGVLLHDAEPGELFGAVRVVGRGEAQLSPAVARRVIAELDRFLPEQDTPCPDEFAELTVREREVAALAAEGLTNDEIAERLVVSSATAKTHLSRAMVKVGVHDRAKLVAVAYRTGFARAHAIVDAGGPSAAPTGQRQAGTSPGSGV
jgi:DNA-binding NarL/FixJ family response regulator